MHRESVCSVPVCRAFEVFGEVVDTTTKTRYQAPSLVHTGPECSLFSFHFGWLTVNAERGKSPKSFTPRIQFHQVPNIRLCCAPSEPWLFVNVRRTFVQPQSQVSLPYSQARPATSTKQSLAGGSLRELQGMYEEENHKREEKKNVKIQPIGFAQFYYLPT